MRLDTLTLLNYKNISEANLTFAAGVNCLIGNNGMGKTNVLDAVYYLSFCRSALGQPDTSVIRHGEQFMMLQGTYTRRDAQEDISISLQRGHRKVARRGGKEYQRLSQHIGLLPLVMVSPMDWDLIRGAGDERRKLMNMIIAQGDGEYMDALIRHSKAVEQRNSMIRHEMRDPLLYETVERTLCDAARVIHAARQRWVEAFMPTFMRYYAAVAGEGESVELRYVSALNEATPEQVLAQARERDFALGYTTAGVHRDDIELLLGRHSMRRTGSQGQCKTYTIALRLAQFEFIKAANPTTPILLLDDVFDRLDATRVERIVDVVAGEQFGQIFITDTNREHLDRIVARLKGDHRMFVVADGVCTPIDKSTAQ